MTLKITFIEHSNKYAALEISGIQMVTANDQAITGLSFGLTEEGLQRAYSQLAWILFRRELNPEDFIGEGRK